MSFRYESDLTAKLVERLPDAFPVPGSMFFALELSVRSRVVDVAIAETSAETLRAESLDGVLVEGLKAVTPAQNVILSLVGLKETVSVHGLIQQTGLRAEELTTRYLGPLMDQNLVERASRYRYRQTGWVQLCPRSVIAIEAKLTKPVEALQQATWNQRFADYSFVALPNPCPHMTTEIRNRYSGSGIGVLLVGDDGSILTQLHGRKNRGMSKMLNLSVRLSALCGFLRRDQKWSTLRADSTSNEVMQ